MPKLELDESDIDTIVKYVRIAQPEYRGAVVVNMKRLVELHMPRAEIVALVETRRAMQ